MEQRIHMLLIEDDPDAELLLSYQLGAACGDTLRFTMESSPTLAAGLQRLREEKDFSLVILDLTLPDSAGVDTVARAKAACGEVPIVVLTGRADEALGLEAVAAGAQDFLQKDKLEPLALRRALSYAIQRGLARRLEQLEADIRERRRIEVFKDQVIGTVAHELRSPLTVTKAAIANLADGLAGAMSDEQSQLLLLARRNLERLARIINNFLELSRLESGRARLAPQRVDARRLLTELVDGMRLADRDQRLEWTAALPRSLPPVRVDPDLFCQLAQNLLDNASRFARGRVTVEAAVEGPDLVVSVLDDGPGLDEDQAARLFERFSQAERPQAPGYKGSGLGLAICREIARASGGRVWVEPARGRGVFRASLPLWSNGESHEAREKGGQGADRR
jgi:signal transduction histidine kinase